ncbi:RHS repeat protein, partial [Amycolatopsis rhizosphaerae]
APYTTGRAVDGNALSYTAGASVDVVSGEVITDATDVALPGLLPLLLRRAYASGYPAGRLFGPGWSSTLDQRVEPGPQAIHYFGDDAQILTYPLPATPGEPVLPSVGAKWPLTWQADGSIRIEDQQRGVTRHFTPDLTGRSYPLRAITDRNGHRITFHRNGNRLTGVAHSGGYRVAVDSNDGRVTGLRLIEGTASVVLRRFSYDARGRLAEVIDASGTPFRYGHDQAGRITSWTDRNGFTYTYSYDGMGRVVRCDGPGGVLSCSLEYHPQLQATVTADSLGHRTEYYYDRRAHVTKVVDPLGNSVLTEVDRRGRPLAYADELGQTTSLVLDDNGDPVRITRPDGAVVSLAYNGFRQAVEITRPDGAVWKCTYDERGNLLTHTDPLGAVTGYTYDGHGNRIAITDPLGKTHQMRANAAGLVIAMADAAGNTTRLTRDAFGRVTEIVDPAGEKTQLEYTPDGRLASHTRPDGVVERWRYDGEGNEIAYESSENAVTTTTYGPFGKPASVTQPDGARYGFTYDTELRLITVTGPTELVWIYERDKAGRVTGERDFNGRTTGYHLDPTGHLMERVNGAGQRTWYRRDTLGRIVETRNNSGESAVYAYDSNGGLVRARNSDAVVEYVRDPLGRVLAETVNGARIAREYDPAGHCLRRITPTGAVSEWAYDSGGRPVGLATLGGRLLFERDRLGRETTRRLGQAVALTQTYGSGARISSQSVWKAGSAGVTAVQQRTFAYAITGFLTEIRDTRVGTRRFDLDALGRITGVHRDGNPERYDYDALGNLGHGDREHVGTLVTRAGRTQYKHDAQGRVVHLARDESSWHYLWNADDRLAQATTPDGTVWRYRYDPLGRRIAKQRLDSHGSVAEQIMFAWDGSRLAEQIHSRLGGRTEVITWDYQPGSHRPLTQLHRVEAAQQRFHAIVTDLVGTPTELIDAEGKLTALGPSGLWGAGGSTACPLRFPGQYHDTETGLHYNHHRYYDPAAGSYLSPDPLGLVPGPNHHRYVPNPMEQLDPLGLAKQLRTRFAAYDPADGFVRTPNSLTFHTPHDGAVYADLADTIASGNSPSGPCTQNFPSGSLVPNYPLCAEGPGVPGAVYVNEPNRLSELFAQHQRPSAWAACRDAFGRTDFRQLATDIDGWWVDGWLSQTWIPGP